MQRHFKESRSTLRLLIALEWKQCGKQQRHIGEIISRNGPHKETELPCGNWLGDGFVSNLSLLLFSPLVSPPCSLLGPSSATGRNQYGLVVPPRTMSIHSVKRENWRVVLSGALTKFLYYVLRIRRKIKREKERKGGLLWIGTYSYTSPDSVLPFNRPSTHGNARFIFCANFYLPLFRKVRLFSRSQYRDLTQFSSLRIELTS